MFNYGGFRAFLIKITVGTAFLSSSIFALVSLATFNADDSGVFSSSSSQETMNFFGIYGAYFSSAMLVFFNQVAFLPFLFCFYYSVKTILGIRSSKLSLKILTILLFMVLSCFSFSLVNYQGSLFGNILIDILIYFGFKINEINNVIKIVIFIILLVVSFFLLLFAFELPAKKIKVLGPIQTFLKSLAGLVFVVFRFSWLLSLFKKSKKEVGGRYSNVAKAEPTFSKRNNRDVSRENKPTNNNRGLAYELPSLSLLKSGSSQAPYSKITEKQNALVAKKLEQVLLEFGVEGKIVNFKNGPVVTLYEFVPAPGVKNSKVVSLSDDIARSMSSLTARISSQPGKTSMGIEIPNEKREPVYFGDLIKQTNNISKDKIELALGKDISGNYVFADLKKMPHLLIAGTTGSGKSVGINAMIMSILYSFKPSECKLILIDPKMLELSVYEDIPHLLTPVVTNPNKAVFALKWVVREMENRYQIMSSINVKNIDSFNNKIQSTINSGRKIFREVQTGIDKESRKPIIEKKEIPLEIMPLIVVVVDEMADLMMVAGKEVENLIQRLAQMARASGIHLITATQRPSVDVITGTIKANFPSRISYKVASKFDSRTILNEMGAEQLLGSGDMLFLENGSHLKRLHGGFLSEQEIGAVVQHIKRQSNNETKQDIAIDNTEGNSSNSLGLEFDDQNVDELYSRAVDIVIKNQRVSTSFVQRYLQIGYNRAARIVEKMEEEGIVSSSNNAGKRTVLKEK